MGDDMRDVAPKLPWLPPPADPPGPFAQVHWVTIRLATNVKTNLPLRLLKLVDIAHSLFPGCVFVLWEFRERRMISPAYLTQAQADRNCYRPFGEKKRGARKTCSGHRAAKGICLLFLGFLRLTGLQSRTIYGHNVVVLVGLGHRVVRINRH